MSQKLFSIYIEVILVEVKNYKSGIYIGNMKISILIYPCDNLIELQIASFNSTAKNLKLNSTYKLTNVDEISMYSYQQEVLLKKKKIEISITSSTTSLLVQASLGLQNI